MKIRYSTFPGIQMGHVLQKLIKQLDPSRIRTIETPLMTNTIPRRERESGSQEITHAYLWPRVGQWLKDNDVVITETGTSNFGILEARFPAGVTHISQVLYGSIGYSVGALQGAALAVKEKGDPRRVVLFVGDGSLQLTVQEIAVMIKHGLKPTIFVINNNGYTIERMIHGPNAPYNDITPWKHTQLLDLFGCPKEQQRTFQVHTRTELEGLFKKDEFSRGDKIQLVELFMPKQDAPRALVKVGEITARRNEECV